MGKNKAIFTAWNKVRLEDGYGDLREKMSVSKFLSIMNHNYKNNEYDISYDEVENYFKITYENREYKAYFTPEVTASIKNGKPTYIISELFKLCEKYKKQRDYLTSIQAYNEKIQSIELSGYNELKELRDYKFYLIYLSKKASRTKDEEELSLINSKVNAMLKILTNPFNLKNHFDTIIQNNSLNGEKLEDYHIEKLENIKKSLTNEYYKMISGQGQTNLNNFSIPVKIITQIEETDNLVIGWLDQRKNVSEDENETNRSYVYDISDEDIDEVHDALHEIMRGGRR